MTLTLLNGQVDGRNTHIHVRGRQIVAMGPALEPRGTVIDLAGGAVLPGLHDHHVHLNAMAAQARSVDVGPDAMPSLDHLARALRQAAEHVGPGGWVRAVGYHESTAGSLTRRELDELLPDTPVRVQHRSGALWMLNSAALGRMGDVLDSSDDVERDKLGQPNGRLWRYDSRLQSALESQRDQQIQALLALRDDLLAFGITGVTDATPDLSNGAVSLLSHLAPLRVHLLGASESVPLPDGFTHGPRKLLLHDHNLPDLDALIHMIAPAGPGLGRRRVAVHCVSRESLILTIAALQEVGAVPGDRIEHGSVIHPDLDATLAAMGVVVVTQPDFLRTRGDAYLRDVAPDATLRSAGVPVVVSSDAPYGSADPWRVIASAHQRRTLTGHVLGPDERVSPHQALAGYLTQPDDPAGPPRTVSVGADARLCVLRVPLASMLASPDACHVAGSVINESYFAAPAAC
jgi:predicted amidohydrolase YtcJ